MSFSLSIVSLCQGDHVYVKVGPEVTRVSRIDRMWTDPQGTAFFQGAYYLTPAEVEHDRTRTFFVSAADLL